MPQLPGPNPDGELELVPHDPELAEEYLPVVARNHQRLARWEPWAQDPPTLDSIRGYQRWVAERMARGEALEFLVRLDGAIVGATGARLDGDRPEFGYWIDGALEGKGVASRAVRELLGRLEERGYRRFTARTGVENERSIRLLGRLGFTRSDEPVEPMLLGDRIVPMVRFVRG